MSTHRPAWRWAKRLLFTAFLLGVGTLLVIQARKIEWAEVGQALREVAPTTLALAVLLTGVSYTLYGSFDLLGRRYVGHHLRPWRSLSIGAISYAFNLNIGALVGSAGFRYRLYSRHGISPANITRIIALSITGNWSGYVLLAGLMLSFERIPVPADWGFGADALQWLGPVLLIAVAAYPLLCAYSPRRSWEIRGHVIELPSTRIAMLQLLISVASWLTISFIIWMLLGAAGYTAVLGAVLIAAVAGAIAHIPAGLGVMEAVFLMAFSGQIGAPVLIAALMAYRGVYYLLPLLVAVVLYLTLEKKASSSRERQAPDRTPG